MLGVNFSLRDFEGNQNYSAFSDELVRISTIKKNHRLKVKIVGLISVVLNC